MRTRFPDNPRTFPGDKFLDPPNKAPYPEICPQTSPKFTISPPEPPPHPRCQLSVTVEILYSFVAVAVSTVIDCVLMFVSNVTYLLIKSKKVRPSYPLLRQTGVAIISVSWSWAGSEIVSVTDGKPYLFNTFSRFLINTKLYFLMTETWWYEHLYHPTLSRSSTQRGVKPAAAC